MVRTILFTVAFAFLGGIALGWILWRPIQRFARGLSFDKARGKFALQREWLEAKFLDMAAASGKPRGLRWKDCEWESEVLFARDKNTGHILALISVTISFEAIEGSDMEGLPAVDNLRNATSVFFYQGGAWQTAGKVLFNMNPDEAIEHFKEQYERLELV